MRLDAAALTMSLGNLMLTCWFRVLFFGLVLNWEEKQHNYCLLICSFCFCPCLLRQAIFTPYPSVYLSVVDIYKVNAICYCT